MHTDADRDPAQLVTSTQQLKSAVTNGPWQVPPPLLLRDFETITRVIGRFMGLLDQQIDDAKGIADAIVDELMPAKKMPKH